MNIKNNKSLKHKLYCDENLDMMINPINLSFNDISLEKNFIKKFNNDNILYTRFGIILTFILFTLYAAVDAYAYPSSYTSMWIIRLFEDIMLIAFFIYTFNPKYKKHLQRNNILLVVMTGLNLIALYSFKIETSYVYIFIASYTLLITGAFFTVGLLFFNALITVLLLDLVLAGILIYIELDAISMFLLGVLFLSISILVVVGAYFLELNKRKLYLNNICNDKLLIDLISTQKELQDQANRDPMTNLYNRRYLYEFSKEVIQMSRKEEKPLSIILLDIDDFKIINDTYGHAIGDDVIISLSSFLHFNTRNSDIVCRHGGEEFVILLPNTDEDAALQIAEKLRTSVEEYKVTINQKLEIKLTISLGISSVDISNEKDIDKALGRADNALYKVKHSGKNSVEIYIKEVKE